jgi:hypothetical protein
MNCAQAAAAFRLKCCAKLAGVAMPAAAQIPGLQCLMVGGVQPPFRSYEALGAILRVPSDGAERAIHHDQDHASATSRGVSVPPPISTAR